jgi:hypothetical protein
MIRRLYFFSFEIRKKVRDEIGGICECAGCDCMIFAIDIFVLGCFVIDRGDVIAGVDPDLPDPIMSVGIGDNTQWPNIRAVLLS